MGPAPAIGIDLGTTFSLAAVYRKGKAEIIPNKEGHRLTPSFVFYSPDSLDVSVGTTADEMGVNHIENFLFDIKRLIGRKYDDAYIQELKKLPDYHFKMVRGENDMAEIELTHDYVTVKKTPEQASSEILKYLRESATEYLGTEVTEAVISIPAHFSNAQRKATRAAAELAGFKVLKLITEPVAGAVYYAQDRLETEGTLLVVDLGGGTLDVSIIEVDEKTFKVKSVEGDTFLGGRDFDQILLQHFKADVDKTFGLKFGSIRNTNRFLRRLKNSCINIKIKLSNKEDYSLPIEFVNGRKYQTYTLKMTRSEFENLTDKLCIEIIALVGKCITEAGMLRSDIDEVLLVGGSTRIPKVRKMVSSYFNNKKLKMDLNPDEAVALGAAIQAAMIKDKCRDLEKYKITEVTPLSLGTDSSFNKMAVCIEKNTPLPFKSKPISYKTSENNQKSARFSIYEGERMNCKYNNFLASFTVNNLPPGKAGTVNCEAIFSLNEDGILEIEAYEKMTKETTRLVLTIGKYSLCDYEIKNLVQDAKNNKKEDEIFKKFVILTRKINQICNHILYDINKIPLTVNRKFVERRCKELKNFIKDLEYTEIKSLEKEYRNFLSAVRDEIKGYIDVSLDDITVSIF